MAIASVAAVSVDDAISKTIALAKQHNLKVLRLRFFGHGEVGSQIMGGDKNMLKGKVLKLDKHGKLQGGEALKKLEVAMAPNGWVELQGCSIMDDYEEPSVFDGVRGWAYEKFPSAAKKLGVDKPAKSQSGEFLKAIANAVRRPVRAATGLQPAVAMSIDTWDGTVYEAKPGGTLSKYTTCGPGY